jgi:DNA-binding CsgD family transcriptional regulator
MTTVLDGHGSGVIIFDDTYRVITITGVALKLSDAIFSCQPAEGALLPDSLLSSVLRLKGISESHPVPPRLPLSYALPDGSCALLRLALDPERARHSLILEHERGIPSVAQLAPLGLTRRESEVTHWILQGKTNWEIGTILGVSSRTVEKHVENLFAKLKVNDRRHLHHRIRESMPR